MFNRQEIPAETKRQVLVEARHQCAVCGNHFPLEIAHIDPWSKSHDNSKENLICMCILCHRKADLMKWDKKTFMMYKIDPFAFHKNRTTNEDYRLSIIECIIEMQISNFTKSIQTQLRQAFADFLKIAIDKIRIIDQKGGSVILIIMLPFIAANELIKAFQSQNKELLYLLNQFINIITLKQISIIDTKRQTSTNEIFISYSHKNKDITDKFRKITDKKLTDAGISYVIDEELTVGSWIKDYIDSINKYSMVIIFISDAFLKSFYCMYEMIILYHNPSWKEKMFPVIIGEFQFSSENNVVRYLDYWNDIITERKKIEQNIIFKKEITKEICLEIHKFIPSFFDYLKGTKLVSMQALREKNYEQYIKKLREIFPLNKNIKNLSSTSFKSDTSQKAIILVRKRIKKDFEVRKTMISNQVKEADHNWFIRELRRCNIGNNYIPRPELRRKVENWISNNDNSYLFLIGPSGYGKTNFLIQEILRPFVISNYPAGIDFLSEHIAIFLPLYFYNPASSFIDNITWFINRDLPSKKRIEPDDLKVLAKKRRIIIILDGLDEYITNLTDRKYDKLINSFESDITFKNARIIISCRNNIYERYLLNNDLFKNQNKVKIDIELLKNEQIEDALLNRIKTEKSITNKLLKQNPKLKEFLGSPLLLEMMCQYTKKLSIQKAKKIRPGIIYLQWFKKMIKRKAWNDVMMKLGKIAVIMLVHRKDIISEKDIIDANFFSEQDFTILFQNYFHKAYFPILISQGLNELSFAHKSFRDFCLAFIMKKEFMGIRNNYDIIIATKHFDYVGDMIYSFLNDLIIDDNRNFNEIMNYVLKGLLAYKFKDDPDNIKWNTLLRNCFEAIGLVVNNELINPPDQEIYNYLKFILKVLGLPFNEKFKRKIDPEMLYNVCRCLVRLHAALLKPIYKQIFGQYSQKQRKKHYFTTYTICGAHMPDKVPSRVTHRWTPKIKNDKKFISYQVRISKALIRLLNWCVETKNEKGYSFVQINCAYALIRWLPYELRHDIKKILNNNNLHKLAKVNLYFAIIRLPVSSIFNDFVGLFKGMETLEGWDDISLGYADFFKT